MLEYRDGLDGDALLRWGLHCVDALARRCDEINDLNVFPVADSDTGTNLLATMRAAIDSVGQTPSAYRGAGEVIAAMATAATHGARGNSGLFAAQFLRGLATALEGLEVADPAALRRAIRTSSDLVRTAVSTPVEGTIVTVIAGAALGAQLCSEESDLASIAIAAADGATEALERTPRLLSMLDDAGVVDSGGLGLVVMFEALVAVITGVARPVPTYARHPHSHSAVESVAETGEFVTVEQDYEVMYLVDESTDDDAARLRSRLNELGDSVLVVNDGAHTWSVHVHCRDAGSAIEAGMVVGSIRSVRVNCFAVERERAVTVNNAGLFDRGVLAVVHGAGAAALFEHEGATVVRADQALSAGDLVAAIRAMVTREVLVLPNGALSAPELMAVGVAARDRYRDVLLLPTASMVQGLASVAVHDACRLAVDDAFAMSQAAGSTRWGSIQRAAGRALTIVGTCQAGDGLGLLQDEVVIISPDPLVAGIELFDRVLGLGAELVTLLVGGSDEAATVCEAIAAHLDKAWPGVEVATFIGGQLNSLVEFGIE